MGEIKEKPALGVEPAWLHAWSRIADLVDAIERQYYSQDMDAAPVKKWAREIILQCEIIEKFPIRTGKDTE